MTITARAPDGQLPTIGPEGSGASYGVSEGIGDVADWATVGAELTLTFVRPLIGWPQAARFSVNELGPGLAPFARMVCLDQPGLEFVVVLPGCLFADYVVEIPEADVGLLGLGGLDDVCVLALVSRRLGQAPTVNLLGPIVANRHDGRCVQLVLADSGYGSAVPADALSSRPHPPEGTAADSAARSSSDHAAAATLASRT
jgi:flagellar assembly factor FliW